MPPRTTHATPRREVRAWHGCHLDAPRAGCRCQNAARLQRALQPWRTEQLLLSETPDMAAQLAASAGCTALRLVPPDDALRAVAAACIAHLKAGRLTDIDSKDPRSSSFFKRVSLTKWAVFGLTQYDAVVFADADLELLPLAEHGTAWAAAAWRHALQGLLRAPHARLLSDPDARSPLNAGLLLVRPSAHLYEEGLATLRRCSYNRSHGWDLVGAPGSLGIVPTRLGGAPAQLAASDARLRDWRFVAADQDQGLIFYMLYVRQPQLGAHGAGGYGAARRAGLPLSRHWWAGFKPFMEIGQAATALASLRVGSTRRVGDTYADLLYLAKLYDYVVREFDPPRRGARAHGARAAAPLPRCVSEQRELRREIERHAHFDEIHYWWQQHHWTGDGYSAWPTLPGEPLLSSGKDTSA